MASPSVSGACTLLAGGLCARSLNYPNKYNHNDACTISNVPAVPLTVLWKGVQDCTNCACDYLEIDGTRYCNSNPLTSGAVATGGSISWQTDGTRQVR